MPSLVPLDKITGAPLIGLIVSSIIYGVTCLQVYLYYTEHSTGDGNPLKLFVATLMVLDTLHLALISHTIYYYTITNFGDYTRLAIYVWSIEVQVIIACLITVLVQISWSWRIYILSSRKNMWLPCLILLSAVGYLASSIAFVIFGFRYSRILHKMHNKVAVPWTLAGFGLSSELVGDALITAGMTIYLVRARTTFERTNRAINMLITYTLNTGLLTTVFILLTLCTFIKFTATMLYAPFFFVVARLYSCAFMSTLNSRKTVRSKLEASSGMQTNSFMLSNIGSSSDPGSGTKSGPSHTQVFVTSSKEVMR